MAYNKKGYYCRARLIQEITLRYYEPENHQKCKKAVWRRYIRPTFGICYDSYLKYLHAVPPPGIVLPPQNQQLSLFESPL